jgi:lipoprotein-anchoring transpeptidase ErfK/SrfK
MQSSIRKIRVLVATQTLELWEGDTVQARFPVSTSRYGLGSEPGSYKTPLGQFVIAEAIGAGAPLGAVFQSRVPTGAIGALEDPGNPEDAVQTRILWLDGVEPHNANTRERYIYLHGTNHEEQIGQPVSHGCVRLRNADIAALFEAVGPGTPVEILDA